MNRTFVILVIVMISITLADSATQTDWSGGDGFPGPVLEWDSTFNQNASLNYVINGNLLLGFSPTLIEHIPLIDAHFGTSPKWGDINRDGYSDLLAVDAGDDSLFWYENPRDTTSVWTKHYIDCPGDVISIALISLEGCTPAFVIDHEQNGLATVECYYRYESGTWYRWYVGELGDSNYGTGATSGDVDGNGHPDIVGWKWAWDEIVIWWDMNPSQEEVLLHPHTPTNVFIFDGDSDGDGDLAVNKSWYPETVIYWNQVGGWLGTTLPDLYYAYDIDAGDIDEDGMSEVTAVSYGRQYLFRNEGSYWDSEILTANSDLCAIVDLDEDNDLDIVGFGGDTFQLFYNCNSEGVLFHASLRVEFYANRMACIDMNSDSRPDLVLTNTPTGEVRWYDHQVCYETEGYIESSILYLGCDPDWDFIMWTSETPTGTSVSFQVRSSDEPSNMGAWSDTLEAPCSLEGILDDYDSYVQYKVILQTSDPNLSPVLDDVTLTWSPLGICEGSSPRAVELLPFYPNPSTGTSSARFSLPEAAAVKLLIYDLSGRLVSGAESLEYPVGYHSVQLRDLVSGVYFCRMVSGNISQTRRFVILDN